MSIKESIRKYGNLRATLKKTFSFKVFKAFAVSMLIVLFAFTLFFIYYQNRIVRENLVKEGKMFADLLAYSSRTGVFAENKDLLKDAVQGIMSQQDVLAVLIYTSDNKILLHDQKKALKNKNMSLWTGEKKGTGPQAGRGVVLTVAEDGDMIEVSAPVIIESPANLEETFYFDNTSSSKKQEVVGYVTVTMDKSVLGRNILAILLQSFFIAAAFLLSGTVIVYLSIKRVTQPLTRLTEAVRLFGLGESAEKVSAESSDEVGKLTTAFNVMSDNLKKRDEEKQLLEERLRYAQKMEAVGTLARGIAHDFNNILATTQGSVYMLEKKLHESRTLKHYIAQIHHSINKAKNLIDSLLTFSRIQRINPVFVEVNDLIRRLMPMLENIVGENIQVKFFFSEDALMIKADTLQIEQVLMNLCANARDAMPDGGVMAIETKSVTAANDEKMLSSPTGKWALISVGDSGVGMDEGLKERIFEPFFTTKEVGKGTGLGLAIVYGIIEQYNGHVEVKTRKGGGTTFLISFPLREKIIETGNQKEEGYE
jgi:signal transduction histidine kinase